MRQGVIISGIAHLALILWLLLGGVFSRVDEPEFSATEVSILTAEEFDRLLAPDLPVADTSPPIEETVEPEPVEVEVEEVAEAPVVETEAPVIPDAPIIDDTPQLNPVSGEAPPEQADRVGPVPVEAPEPEINIAETLQEAIRPAEAPTEVIEQEETAQEETAVEIVTEAEEVEETGTSAPIVSPRPPRRPERPVPEETPEPEPEPEVDPLEAAISEAVAEAAETAEVEQPVGPPLSFSEIEGFRVAVGQCWDVDSGGLSSFVTVTVRFELNQDGSVIRDSVELIDHDGTNEAGVQNAYERARRSILRCQGRGGYDLPAAKYAHWRVVEATFNPDGMRLR